MDGVFYFKSVVVNQTGSTDIDVVSNIPCGTLLAVAVGGGGTTTSDAGSGSGYVEYREISVSSGVGQHLRAEVGGAQETTKLVDLSTSSTLLTANPGGNGGSDKGADGYSGGGADYNGGGGNGGDGGSGGGDGRATSHYSGGSGSGFDIGIIPLNTIVLR